ncbi:MAG: hypothetical protein CMH22_00570 [Methylophaga sp.]|uniref:restriction endonuclease subunit S n=1 Tax=Methylophaga sp. UBA678 TaxID=1946901 RepID=UPI000C5491BD|nr:restriction endonuclease subunit S [Methylophaga sp. UBA678]MAX50456.1 hypothetical protein [Methylophaga sp.]
MNNYLQLRDCISLFGGGTPSKQNPEYWNGKIAWASVKDLKSSRLQNTQDSITELGLSNSSSRLVKAGSIIIATRMAVGKAVITDIDVAINQDLKAIVCKETIDVKYLFYFLLSSGSELDKVSSGATVKGIKLNHILDLQIPLPPLTEQKQIAAILDAADKLRQKDQQLVQHYTALSQSLFLDMFGDPVSNSMRWEKKTLSCFIESLETGTSVNSSDEKYSFNKFGILKTSCVYTGEFRATEAKVIRDDEYDRMKLNPRRDSIIISRMNTTELVGKSAYIARDYPNLFVPDRLWLSNKSNLDQNVRWLSFAISLNSFMHEISKISSGTSGSMKNISKKNFLSLPMIYPPAELQNQFAERVEVIEKQKQQAQMNLEKSEMLFNSLLQRAFTGELTVNKAA